MPEATFMRAIFSSLCFDLLFLLSTELFITDPLKIMKITPTSLFGVGETAATGAVPIGRIRPPPQSVVSNIRSTPKQAFVHK